MVEKQFQGKWVLAGAAVVLLSMAAGGLTLMRRDAPGKAKVAGTPEPVKLAAGAEVSYSGLISARNVVLVAAPVEGTMDAVEVEPGQEVFEGQLLGRIRNEGMEGVRTRALEEFESVQSRLNNMESSLIAARLESSRASADASRAQGEYDRLRAVAQREELLMREGATARNRYEKAQRDFENAKNEYEGLREIARQAGERVAVLIRDIEAARRSLEEKQASLEAAQNDLAAAEVHAPVDGVLIAAKAKPGDTVTAGTEDLFQIATNPQQLKLTVEPEPDVLERLKVPAPVLVLVAELPQQPIEGELKSIEDGKAVVEFDAPDVAVKPGLTATVRLKIP